ncbi:TIGR01459 family HAD-type hydrolase [Roseibium sp. AS2]|uniref:TIGR01459 family HAD-type hydrolase n=1 Tax=Roseibium sp. AS2 TaxID=3135781 RepID=UPI00317B4A74
MNSDSVTALTSILDVLPDYDVFLIDQWGVLHEGHAVYPGAHEALREIKQAGKTTLILTNSSKSNLVNADRLERQFGIGSDCYDHIVSSAHYLIEALVRNPASVWPGFAGSSPRAFVLADGRDIAIVEESGLACAPGIAEADYVLLLSVPPGEGSADHEHWIPDAIRRGLPLVCPSADLHSVSVKGLVNGLESVVSAYARGGGSFVNFGKPSSSIYEVVRSLTDCPAPARVLAIGDQTGSDIAGAKLKGYHSLLVLTGAGTARLGTGDLEKAAGILDAPAFPEAERPHYIMTSLKP